MRPGNDVPPRVALPPAATSSLCEFIGIERAAFLPHVEPRICPILIPAPDPRARVSVTQPISLKPSGFPSLRENL